MSDNNRYHGTQIGSILEEQGRKARWLARQLQVSESYLSMVISGQRTIDERNAIRVSNLLGVDFFTTFELRERSDTHPMAEAIPA